MCVEMLASRYTANPFARGTLLLTPPVLSAPARSLPTSRWVYDDDDELFVDRAQLNVAQAKSLATRKNLILVWALVGCLMKIKRRQFNGPVQAYFSMLNLSEPMLGGASAQVWGPQSTLLGMVQSRTRFTAAMKKKAFAWSIMSYLLAITHFRADSVMQVKLDNFELVNKADLQVRRNSDMYRHLVIYNFVVSQHGRVEALLPDVVAQLKDPATREVYCAKRTMPWKTAADMMPTPAMDAVAVESTRVHLKIVIEQVIEGSGMGVHHDYTGLTTSNIEPTPGVCPATDSMLLDADAVNLADKRTQAHIIHRWRNDYIFNILSDKLREIDGVTFDPGTNPHTRTGQDDKLELDLPTTEDGWSAWRPAWRKPTIT
jgi:hypothetical protein